MPTAAQLDLPPLDGSTLGGPLPSFRAKRRPGRLLGKNIWAMGDQILISGTNFVTTVLIARALSPSAFGTFTLVYSAILLANIFQSTLITQAHNVLAADRTGEAYRRYTSNAALSQLLLALIEAAAALAVALVAAMQGSSITAILFWVAPSIVAWQLQEFIRRVLYTENRFAAAFWNDCIAYGAQAALVAVLWYAHHLDALSALVALAVTSSGGVALGIWQIRKSIEFKLDLSVFSENWAFGKWLIGGELLQWLGSLQLYLFLAAYLIGANAAGELRAAQTIFGPTRVFSFYLGTVLPIRFARTLAEEGPTAVNDLLMATCFRVLPLLGSYCLLIAAFPHFILRWVFGSQYAGTPAVLSIYAFYAFMSYFQMLLVSVLTAKRLTRLVFVANLYGTLIPLALSYFVILYFKISGVPITIGISALIITAYLWRVNAADSESERSVRSPLAIGLA